MENLRERFIRHCGNADVVRQELKAEKGLHVTLRTVERAVKPYRQALKAEALACVRFETSPGHQLQIDFGERLVEIAGERVKAFMFVGTLGYSRRCHVLGDNRGENSASIRMRLRRRGRVEGRAEPGRRPVPHRQRV